MPQFAEVAVGLYDLTKKGVKGFPWELEHQRTLDTLKRTLSEEGLVLRQPVADLPFVLHTDWSVHGVGAALKRKGVRLSAWAKEASGWWSRTVADQAIL
jgi:hypothetical protein